MAQKRMFSKNITESDKFLDMPISSQCLYFHLGMSADDDGFVSPNKVLRMIGATKDDIKILEAKNFVIPFDSGVIVITHWHENNLIRKDRYQETIYREEKQNLLCANNFYSMSTIGIPLVDQRLPQVGREVREVGSKVDNENSLKKMREELIKKRIIQR